jgi:hypothetical protein
VFIIAEFCYNQEKGYSRNYIIGYIASTCINIKTFKCDDIKVFNIVFFLYFNCFLTKEAQKPQATNRSPVLPDSAHYIQDRFNKGLMWLSSIQNFLLHPSNEDAIFGHLPKGL